VRGQFLLLTHFLPNSTGFALSTSRMTLNSLVLLWRMFENKGSKLDTWNFYSEEVLGSSNFSRPCHRIAVCAAPKRRFKPYDAPVARNANDQAVRKGRKAELKASDNG
jgi:hypothetical protein